MSPDLALHVALDTRDLQRVIRQAASLIAFDFLRGEVFHFEDYFGRVTGCSPHARGYQVHLYVIGAGRFITAGLSEFMVGAQHQPRF